MAKKHDEKKDGDKAENIYKYDPEVEAYLRIKAPEGQKLQQKLAYMFRELKGE